MADVFLSYAKSNYEMAKALAEDLQSRGFDVWWDTKLESGEMYQEVIARELNEAKAVIVIWTPESVNSAWVLAEADHAQSQKKLVTLRSSDLELLRIPKPYNVLHTGEVGDRNAVLDSLSRRFLLTPSASRGAASRQPAAPPSADEALFAEVSQDGAAEAYEFYLKRYPAGAYAAVAEYRLKKLGQGITPQTGATAASPPAPPPVAGDRIKVLVGAGNAERLLKPGAGLAETFKDADFAPEMVVVPAGRFQMGSAEDDKSSDPSEWPRHEVAIARPFAVARAAVSFAEFDACVADGGCEGYQPDDKGWGRGEMPVVNVSWDDAQAYIRWLSQKTGKPYRLLTEAEWEYACRAGSAGSYAWGESISPALANYDPTGAQPGSEGGEFRRRTAPVTAFECNAFGLRQMHGNVKEWVEDCWHDDYTGAPADGSAWVESGEADVSRRVVRGGSWYDYARRLRSAARQRNNCDLRNFNIGFRVARTLE